MYPCNSSSKKDIEEREEARRRILKEYPDAYIINNLVQVITQWGDYCKDVRSEFSGMPSQGAKLSVSGGSGLCI
jgi:hypothetical protein